MDSAASPTGRLYTEHRQVGVTASVEIVVQGLLNLPGAEPAEARKPERKETPTRAGVVLTDKHTQAAVRGMLAMADSRIGRTQNGVPFWVDATGHAVFVGEEGALSPFNDNPVEQSLGEMLGGASPEQARVFFLCMMYWFEETGGDPAMPFVRVRVRDLLAARGMARQQAGGWKTEQKQELARVLWSLNRIRIKGAPEKVWESWGRSGKRERTVQVVAPVFHVEHEYLLEEPEDELYAFRIRPGGWAKDYLEGLNRWTGLMPRVVLTYDISEGVGSMAFRLCAYLVPLWRIRAKNSTFGQPYNVETILDGAGISHDIEPKRYPRFRQQFDAALAKLAADQAVGGWGYVGDSPEASGRGWFSKWLRKNVSITPPDYIRAHYAEIQPRHERAIASARAGAEAAARRKKARERGD